MNTANMYSMSLNEVANAIRVGGNKRTILAQGHMGIGKSSILKMLARDMPNHLPCYFDCNTKDLGDITVPDLVHLDGGAGYVRYLTNEELGVHHNQPIALMVDEFGKANQAVKNALLRVMLEHKIGSLDLHPDSVVFGTTNLGAEGVGDLLKPHEVNRITHVRVRKPTNMEWLEWAVVNDIHPTIMSWVKDTPQLFASFEDIENAEENPYIYHPRAVGRASFVTGRSLEAASDWLKLRDELGDNSTTSLIMGCLGARAAMDLNAYITLSDKLPTLKSIKETPESALVPDNAAAVCMVVYRALQAMERDWVGSWMTYVARLGKEAQALFVNGVRAPHYSRAEAVVTNKVFSQWAMDNGHLFAADKK